MSQIKIKQIEKNEESSLENNGISAFDIANKLRVEAGLPPFDSEQDFIDSLRGKDGKDGTVIDGMKGDPGEKGDNGKSAYDIAVDNGYSGTETDWLESLKGEPGEVGPSGTDGLSAYDIAVKNGYAGTETEWLASLKGEKGDRGEKGESATGSGSSVDFFTKQDAINLICNYGDYDTHAVGALSSDKAAVSGAAIVTIFSELMRIMEYYHPGLTEGSEYIIPEENFRSSSDYIIPRHE